jgi:cyclophilin family peptidyl-prolyl cis-trans isomerase/HEAT repeat protein
MAANLTASTASVRHPHQEDAPVIAGGQTERMSRHISGAVALFMLLAAHSTAQTPRPALTRLAVLQAEDRRAPAARDLAVIRAGTHSDDPQTARIAVRALGRLERPSLVADILPSLKHPLPEIRAEAANALGQALKDTKSGAASPAIANTVIDALITRLSVEAEASVRGAVFETLGRTAATAIHAERVEAVLVDAAAREATNDGRLGIASGFEALVRLRRGEHPPQAAAINAMRSMVSVSPPAARRPLDPSRDVRVRRLALEALVTAEAVDDATLGRALHDPDPQVRRLAMRAAAAGGPAAAGALTAGLTDTSSMVRIEALRAMRSSRAAALCSVAVTAAADRDPQVVLVALDQLAACSASPDAVALLERIVSDPANVGSPREWHRAAHALVALAGSSPDKLAAALGPFATSLIWQLRMYAARAAAIVKDAVLLEKLAADDEDNVREAAVEGLAKVAGHSADPVYVRQMNRTGYQILRAAAAALAGTPNPDTAVPALRAAHERLVAEGRDNSHDARAAIEKTLADLRTPAAADGHASSGAARAPVAPALARSGAHATGAVRSVTRDARDDSRDLSADDLRRLAAARALVTMRGIGTFELVLFTWEAPASVLRFTRLAEAGYYNGLTFHRVVPNFVIQGGSPGANEYIGDATFMRDEVGQWPHVRGAVGISTRGRDTGDAQIFIDLVDNPRLNHEYTVFAQVLNGLDVIDQVLEGDVIEKIEIVVK